MADFLIIVDSVKFCLYSLSSLWLILLSFGEFLPFESKSIFFFAFTGEYIFCSNDILFFLLVVLFSKSISSLGGVLRLSSSPLKSTCSSLTSLFSNKLLISFFLSSSELFSSSFFSSIFSSTFLSLKLNFLLSFLFLNKNKSFCTFFDYQFYSPIYF